MQYPLLFFSPLSRSATTFPHFPRSSSSWIRLNQKPSHFHLVSSSPLNSADQEHHDQVLPLRGLHHHRPGKDDIIRDDTVQRPLAGERHVRDARKPLGNLT